MNHLVRLGLDRAVEPRGLVHRLFAIAVCLTLFGVERLKSKAPQLFAIAVCLTLLSIAAQLAVHFVGGKALLILDRALNVDREINVPTLFSALLLFACAVLLAQIARSRRGERYAWHWWILAGVFLFLALDEAVKIHERIGILLHLQYNTSGIFRWAWVIPYGAAIVLLTAAYLGFFLHLPARTRSLFFAAAALFIGGALGVEMIQARHFESVSGEPDLFYYSLVTVEEFLEMTGAIVFIHALFEYPQGTPSTSGDLKESFALTPRHTHVTRLKRPRTGLSNHP
jgi:hypothetical protein